MQDSCPDQSLSSYLNKVIDQNIYIHQTIVIVVFLYKEYISPFLFADVVNYKTVQIWFQMSPLYSIVGNLFAVAQRIKETKQKLSFNKITSTVSILHQLMETGGGEREWELGQFGILETAHNVQYFS